MNTTVTLPVGKERLDQLGNTEFSERSLLHAVASLVSYVVRTFQKASCDDRKPKKLLKNEGLLRGN